MTPPCSGGRSSSGGDRYATRSDSSAASTPWSRSIPAGSTPPSTVIPPSRPTSVTAGRRPTNDHLPHRSACSTDSSRKPGSSPTTRANAATGVVRSASTSRHTGTTVWARASARNSSLVGRSTGTERAVEAGARAGVARARSLLLDDEEKGVAVAVVVRPAHPLAVARCLPLHPLLLPRPAPVRHAPGLERPAQRGLVHPRQHQHVVGGFVLHHRGHQTVGVVRDEAEVFVTSL